MIWYNFVLLLMKQANKRNKQTINAVDLVDLTGGVYQRLRDGGKGGGVELFLYDPLTATFFLCCFSQPSFNLDDHDK